MSSGRVGWRKNFILESVNQSDVDKHNAELDRVRGAAALKSIGDSPNASRLLAGKGRNQRSNEIVSKSIERSGLNRDQLVSAAKNDRPRYNRMLAYANKSNAEREAIAQRAGTELGQGLAGRVKTEAPKTETPKPTMDPFAAGGGNAKMKATGMTRDQVIALGNKNLKNQKPNTNTNTSTTQTPTKTAPTSTQPVVASRSTSPGLTPEQIKQYNRAWSNKGNLLARGTIRGHYNKLTPEQQKAFRAHAQSQGHDWGNYFECYFDAVDSGRIIITEAILGKIVKAAARQLLKKKTLAKQVTKQTGQIPKQLKFKKVFHGTNTPASAAISKGGFRTDTNVSRQMLGKGVYTSPDNYTAAMYAQRAAKNFGGEPTLRQLRVPQDVAKRQTTRVRQGTGDYSGKGYDMTTLTPQQANKYDVTDKLPQGVFNHDMMMSPTSRRELRQRVQRALQNPNNRRVLRNEIKRGSGT